MATTTATTATATTRRTIEQLTTEEVLNTCLNTCISVLESLNIEHGNISDIKINYRAYRRWGLCKHDNITDTYIIEVNADLLDKRNSNYDNCYKPLMNTIMHELLHTVNGCMNHGKEWQAVADRVNRSYDGFFNVKRCSTAEEKGVEYKREPTPRREEEYKYIYQCSGCGCYVRRKRASKFVQNPQNYHCAKCGGKLIQVK